MCDVHLELHHLGASIVTSIADHTSDQTQTQNSAPGMQRTIDEHADGGGHGSVHQEVALFIVHLRTDKHPRQLAHRLLIFQVWRPCHESAMHTLHSRSNYHNDPSDL